MTTCTFTQISEQIISGLTLKEVFSDSNNIILWHELEENKKSLFPKFQLIPIQRF